MKISVSQECCQHVHYIAFSAREFYTLINSACIIVRIAMTFDEPLIFWI
jgi:hypothetical protein